ncbi:MAG: Ni/Fe hydrogenase subunit alpha [Planctomycetota bacterium]
MSREITIEPVTRIEGHAKITIQLDDSGSVDGARFHVTQFRGFEKFTEGRPFYEMPALTARICGICPVSHMLASGKACDDLLAVRVPETASQLRRLLNYAQIVQSHALSFFHLSAPDLLMGMDEDPSVRNVLGLAESQPEAARAGIRLRRFGQELIEALAGKRIHAAWVVAGGVTEPFNAEDRDRFADQIPEMMEIATGALDTFKRIRDEFEREISAFACFPTRFMGLVQEDGTMEHFDGLLRMHDSEGNPVVDDFDPATYEEVIQEAVEPWTYLKFPYYADAGYPEGVYRVGPLARCNIVDQCGTPKADQELTEFRQLSNGPVQSSFFYHYARLIEIIHGLERIQQLLDDPGITSQRVRARAEANAEEGVGVSEAPRGTLIHHYRIDDQARIKWVNFIIATGHNNLAMNQGVEQVAREFIDDEQIPEGMLNRVEAVIRAFDPCLSCSTHAIGQMPFHIELHNHAGETVDQLVRET